MNSKGERRPRAKGAKLGDGEPVEHTPIIIDGGSAKIDFSEEEYPDEQVEQHTSAGLFLKRIKNRTKTHPDTGSPICYEVQPDEVCQVVVHCKLPGHNESNFVITGGGKDAVLNGDGPSPIIDFDEHEYRAQAASQHRRAHGNAERKIVKLEIYRLSDGERTLIHDCPLIPPNGKCSYKVFDPHLEDDDQPDT